MPTPRSVAPHSRRSIPVADERVQTARDTARAEGRIQAGWSFGLAVDPVSGIHTDTGPRVDSEEAHDVEVDDEARAIRALVLQEGRQSDVTQPDYLASVTTPRRPRPTSEKRQQHQLSDESDDDGLPSHQTRDVEV